MLSGHPSQNGDQATLLSRRQLAPHWRWSRHRRHDASEATRKRRAVLSLSPQVVPQAQRETDLLLYLGWWIELFFASLKGQGRLAQLPSSKKAVVEALIWSSILADICSRRLYRWLRAHIPAHRYLPPRRFAKVFERVMADVLDTILDPDPRRTQRLLQRLRRHAPDPNRRRPRSLQAIPIQEQRAEVIGRRQRTGRTE